MLLCFQVVEACSCLRIAVKILTLEMCEVCTLANAPVVTTPEQYCFFTIHTIFQYDAIHRDIFKILSWEHLSRDFGNKNAVVVFLQQK